MRSLVPGFSNPTVMNHDFSKVPHADIQRSSFKRSHGLKTTFGAGYLIPIYVDEALPGDTFNLRLSSVVRMTSLIAPLMDNLHMDVFFFAVPNRLVWSDFQHFMGEKDNPDDSTEYVVPQIPCPAGGFVNSSLADYFGLPTEVDDIEVNALHFRAYNLIWNEWFRDQNLQDSVVVDKDAGPDDPADYVLLKRGKRHDYFTSCLPWPQKGPGVELPLGTSAPVIGNDIAIGLTDGAALTGMYYDGASALHARGNKYGVAVGDAAAVGGASLTAPRAIGLTDDPDYSGLIADLSGATASTINSLREAFQLQILMERDARGGTRYVELIKAHFGVTSPDARLQRPEYLGGGSVSITIDPVPTLAYFSGTENVVGKLRAIGYSNQSGIGFTKSFVEHSVILGMVSVRADLTYQCGIDRMWSRQTKYDFYWPALAHLGEQEVLNKEIYAQGSSVDTGATGTPDDDRVFGYQERWAEYRYKPSKITGQMRSNFANSLDVWHLSQEFSSLPVLNDEFIEEDPPISRVQVVSASEAQFKMDAFFDLTCTRPMPIYSVPGLIDHF